MITALLAACSMAAPADDLLPDITCWEEKLYDNAIDTTTIPGQKLLRLTNGTPNIGLGRLELRGGQVVNGQQQVNQRIYRTDGTWWERQAGTFTYHSSHGHIHFDDWSVYRLREITQGGGVGDIIAEGSKTSFCILDLVVHNSNNPNFRTPGYYSSCGAVVQGLTPGWADIYSKNLTDQWIVITNVPDGTYWLEAEVDPDNLVLEEDETNNAVRIQITLENPPEPERDAFEDNDTKAQVDARTEGELNSPNLGLVNARRTIQLSMEAGDPDWFRFRLNHTGGSGDYVGINSTYSQGDLDMRLYNASGTQIGSSTSGTNNEQISLNGRPAGYYYVQVYPFSGDNPRYTFTIQPSGNLPPSLDLQSPSGHLYVERSFETIPAAWNASDPENDPMKISFFMDRGQTYGKNTLPIGGYQDLPATDGAANINTAEMVLGKWYLIARLTDGGINVYKTAPGGFTVYLKGDMNFDGQRTLWDLYLLKRALNNNYTGSGVFPICDMDRDGDVDRIDYTLLEQEINS